MDHMQESTIAVRGKLAEAIHGLSATAAVYGSDIIAETARLSVYVGKPYMRGPAMHSLEEVRTAIIAVSAALAEVDAVISAEIASDETDDLNQAAE